MIDLHSHTLHSDGDRSPAQLFAEAKAAGVEVLAVTDHDTVFGLEECRVASEAAGVRLVTGIELSCELHGREVHVLGHFLDDTSPAALAHDVKVPASAPVLAAALRQAWPRLAKVEVHDPNAAHKKLVPTLTDKDMHDVTAYLATVK